MTEIHSQVVNVKQGSNEWHTLRASHYGASEVNCVLGKSIWKPKTFQELADVKLGKLELFQNQAMRDGNYYEARARELVNNMFAMIEFNPMVYINNNIRDDSSNLPLMASLDGIDFEEQVIIEIKTSQKNITELYVYYYHQIQQQLLLSGAKIAFLVVYDKEKDRAILSRPILRDDTAMNLIIKSWRSFHKFFEKYKNGVAVNVE